MDSAQAVNCTPNQTSSPRPALAQYKGKPFGTSVPLSGRHKPSTIMKREPKNLAPSFEPNGASKTMSHTGPCLPGDAHSSAPECASYFIAVFARCLRAAARFDGENRRCSAQKQWFQHCRRRSRAKTADANPVRFTGHEGLGRTGRN